MIDFQRVICTLFCFSLSAYAYCQSADTTTKNIDQIVVTAQLEPTSVKKSVYKVRSISADEIERRATTDMTTLLNTQLGVRFSNDMALGETDIQLMGMSGQNVKVLIDGVPLIDRGATKQSLSQIDVNTIEKIEIIEGPVSVSYGTDALAGVINIITKQHQPSKSWHLQARILEETAHTEYTPLHKEGRHNFHLGITRRLKKWDFGINGSRNTFGGWKGDAVGRQLAWQPKDQWLGSANIGLTGRKHQTRLRMDYTNEDIFTPGNYNPNNTYVDKNYMTNRYNTMLQSRWIFDDKWTADGSLSYQNYQRKTVTKRTDLATNQTVLTDGAGEQDVATFDNVFFRGTVQYRISPTAHVQTGVEYDREFGSGDRLKANSVLTQYALFLTGEWTPTTWINVRPGLRFLANSVYQAPPVVPSINTKVMLSSRLDWRASYARGYRAPALSELFFSFFDSNHSIRGNENLKPEYSNSLNSYLSYTAGGVNGSRYDASIGGFYNVFSNRIVLGTDPENANLSTYVNLEKFKTTGIVWENSYSIRNIQATAGLSYIGRYNQLAEQESGQSEFLWSPELNGSIFYTYTPWATSFNLFYKFYGKRPGVELSTAGGENRIQQTHIGSFHQSDFTIVKKFSSVLQASAGIRNLFNITNIVNTGTVGEGAHSSVESAIPISYGRSYFIGLQLNLNK